MPVKKLLVLEINYKYLYLSILLQVPFNQTVTYQKVSNKSTYERTN